MEKKKHNMKIRLEDLMWEKRVKSINSLSTATEISRQTLHRIYNNESDGIRLETIEKLCNYLDCEIEELLVIEKKEA